MCFLVLGRPDPSRHWMDMGCRCAGRELQSSPCWTLYKALSPLIFKKSSKWSISYQQEVVQVTWMRSLRKKSRLAECFKACALHSDFGVWILAKGHLLNLCASAVNLASLTVKWGLLCLSRRFDLRTKGVNTLKQFLAHCGRAQQVFAIEHRSPQWTWLVNGGSWGEDSQEPSEWDS